MGKLNLNRRQYQALKNARSYLKRSTISTKKRLIFSANVLGGVSAAIELAKKGEEDEN